MTIRPKTKLIFLEREIRWSSAISRHSFVRQACTVKHAIDWEDLALEFQANFGSLVFIEIPSDVSTDKLRKFVTEIDLLSRNSNETRFVAIGTPAILVFARELRIGGFCEVFGHMRGLPRAVRMIQQHARSIIYPAIPLEASIATNLPWRPIE